MIDLAPWLDAVPTAVVERLTSARRVLAVGHENPDADTLGATLAICRLVERGGGVASAVFADPIPPIYDFLTDAARARTDPDPAIDYDLLVVSDCGTLDRIGAVRGRHPELFERLPRVVIDHHASNDAAGEADWIEPFSAATCEMVTLLAARLGAPLDEGDGALAADLMAGIVMDTATFAHPNATPRTLAVSAALVEAGAPLSDISRRLYRSKPDAQLKLFGRVLDRLETSADGRIIHSTLLDSDLAAT
ncbi:MAG: bifunctional oligoribonuclease and phosphatase NrnA, partial [Chloroflexota bacterium]|nr:bifunctional oligoribonuclease and phosphatase NrnA [Chloroflexota bacterium]